MYISRAKRVKVKPNNPTNQLASTSRANIIAEQSALDFKKYSGERLVQWEPLNCNVVYPFVGFDYYRYQFCTNVSPFQNLQYPFSAHVRHEIEFFMKNCSRWN